VLNNPESNENRDVLIARLVASRQWERLCETAREKLAEDPEDDHAHLLVAQALINLRRHAEAKIHLEKRLAAKPNDDFAHRMMSMVQFAGKEYAAADESIKRAIAIDPQDSNSWYHLAWMCHTQRDVAGGLKWIMKARELAPNDPDILNLYALCVGNGEERANLLREALALDPENALIINNLGSYYLDNLKDYTRAEQCFRQALAIRPSLKVARQNLFVTIRHRDWIYRTLRAPLDFLLNIRASLWGGDRRGPVKLIIGGLIWFLLFRFVIGGLVLWFALVWPLLKVYEFLVIGDIRKKAGELGSGSGGFMGIRRWPIGARMTIFGILLLGFWSAVVWVIWGQSGNDNAGTISTTAIMVVMVGLLIYLGVKTAKSFYVRYLTWRRQRRLKHLVSSANE
jgi:Flp pilus assembly protein TadD